MRDTLYIFMESRFAIAAVRTEFTWILPNVKSKKNRYDLLILKFKLPSAVGTRMANVSRETRGRLEGNGYKTRSILANS